MGELPIQEVCYCKTTKELLVHLHDTCDRYRRLLNNEKRTLNYKSVHLNTSYNIICLNLDMKLF